MNTTYIGNVRTEVAEFKVFLQSGGQSERPDPAAVPGAEFFMWDLSPALVPLVDVASTERLLAFAEQTLSGRSRPGAGLVGDPGPYSTFGGEEGQVRIMFCVRIGGAGEGGAGA